MRAGILALGVALALSAAAGGARGDDGPFLPSKIARHLPAPWGLSGAERSALLRGAVVSRPVTLRRGGRKYVGGVSYQVVDAPRSTVMKSLGHVESLRQALPRTKAARLVDREGGQARVELTQGNSVVEARYTVILSRSGGSEVRFWLDRSSPHDVADVWGYFRARPFGDRSLVTVAAVVDLGPGIARLLFENRVQRLILDAPRHLRDFVEDAERRREVAQSRPRPLVSALR